MRSIKFLILFMSYSILIGCSSDSGEEAITLSTVVLTTKPAVLNNEGLYISTGGELSSLFEGSEDCITGICYSTSSGPTMLNNIVTSGISINNLEFPTTFGDISFGKTYYIKAFVKNFVTGEIKYGNEVSVSIPISLTTGIIKNISCSGFSLDVNVAPTLGANDERGVCYSTSQNPTINNIKVTDATYGAGNFIVSIENPYPNAYVIPNTTYYLRSYVKVLGNYVYGNEVSFKTGGYIGGSGGYVFFDKGETTNGWRYLEAAPNYLIHNNNVNWHFKWNSCNATEFISGLSNAIGTGAENTSLIRSVCNFTDNAAAMAQSTSANGVTDWFLPSIDELRMLHNLKKESIISYSSTVYPLISSSQQSNNTNYGFDFSTGNQVSMAKTQASRVWQVRRF